MVMLLDTRQMSPNNRARAISALLDAQVATPMAFHPASAAQASFAISAAVTDLGDVRSLRVGGSAVRASRGPQQLSETPEPLVSMVRVRRGTAVVRRGADPSPLVYQAGRSLTAGPERGGRRRLFGGVRDLRCSGDAP